MATKDLPFEGMFLKMQENENEMTMKTSRPDKKKFILEIIFRSQEPSA